MQGARAMKWKMSESKYLKKFAKYGFLFFLFKGLLWLIIPALIALFFGVD